MEKVRCRKKVDLTKWKNKLSESDKDTIRNCAIMTENITLENNERN